jgi:hypothetical protein
MNEEQQKVLREITRMLSIGRCCGAAPCPEDGPTHEERLAEAWERFGQGEQ